MTLMLMFMMSISLSALFIFITLLISFSPSLNKNKLTPFECGFNPMNSPRSSFSIQFFLISILFLIFDIEIVILLPAPITLLKNFSFFFALTMAILVLIFGLMFEWYNGSLKWL